MAELIGRAVGDDTRVRRALDEEDVGGLIEVSGARVVIEPGDAAGLHHDVSVPFGAEHCSGTAVEIVQHLLGMAHIREVAQSVARPAVIGMTNDMTVLRVRHRLGDGAGVDGCSVGQRDDPRIRPAGRRRRIRRQPERIDDGQRVHRVVTRIEAGDQLNGPG